MELLKVHRDRSEANADYKWQKMNEAVRRCIVVIGDCVLGVCGVPGERCYFRLSSVIVYFDRRQLEKQWSGHKAA